MLDHRLGDRQGCPSPRLIVVNARNGVRRYSGEQIDDVDSNALHLLQELNRCRALPLFQAPQGGVSNAKLRGQTIAR